MSEWHLRLPSESQQFCDFVLVFDEIVDDDIHEANNRTGCCSCCQTSSKELQKCIQVCSLAVIDLDFKVTIFFNAKYLENGTR